MVCGLLFIDIDQKPSLWSLSINESQFLCLWVRSCRSQFSQREKLSVHVLQRPKKDTVLYQVLNACAVFISGKLETAAALVPPTVVQFSLAGIKSTANV